ncbi:hypothetical protein ACPPVQ_14390 [Diaminobutyricibacter sp. McL0618]|uniref:hypothetical protein n=1 Tax=Leifsonia sp. McL0618 TaxID=3415677 RepID=UPI003CF55D2D
MEDDAAANPALDVPAGVPYRVRDWLFPPLILVAFAAIEAFGAINIGSRAEPASSVVAVSLLILAAVGLWIFGYLAYRDLTPQAVERYFVTGIVSLIIAGLLLAIGWLLLLWAGRLSASLRFRPLRLLRTVMPARLWLRTAIIAAIVGVICYLLLPLAAGLQLVPLVILMKIGQIVAPLVCGFAFRLRPGASGMF